MSDSARMKESWDRRARHDPFSYVETAHWDGDVDAFYRLGEERTELLIDPVLPQLPRTPAESGALDLGCGLGRFSRALAGRFERVTGVDVSDEMVGRARDLHPPETFSNLTFAAGDGVTLPVESAAFDFVWSYEVFQHMPTLDVVRDNLREVGRVLKADGRALLHLRVAPGRRTVRARVLDALPAAVVRALKRVLGGDPLAGDPSFRGAPPPTAAELPDLFSKAGLELLETREDPTHEPGTTVFAVASPRS
jgi:SAM-dependent methyltransferase